MTKANYESVLKDGINEIDQKLIKIWQEMSQETKATYAEIRSKSETETE